MKFVASEVLQKPKTVLENTIIMLAVTVLSLSGAFGMATSIAQAADGELTMENASLQSDTTISLPADGTAVPFSIDISHDTFEIESASLYVAPEETTGSSQASDIGGFNEDEGTFSGTIAQNTLQTVAKRSSFTGNYRIAVSVDYTSGAGSLPIDVVNNLQIDENDTIPEITNMFPVADSEVPFNHLDQVELSADISWVKQGNTVSFEVKSGRDGAPGGTSVLADYPGITGSKYTKTVSAAFFNNVADNDPQFDGTFTFQARVSDSSVVGEPGAVVSTANSTDLTLPEVYESGLVENITQGTPYDTIQEAIDDASDGNTIEVSEGVYPENLDVSVEGLSLVSAVDYEAIIEGDLKIDGANDVKVQGFKFNSTTDINSERGILSNSDNLYIKNNKFSGYATAITLQIAGGTPSDVVIKGNTFNENWTGIGSTEDVTGLNIDDNTFTNNVNSIGLGAGVELSGNETIAELFDNNDLRFNDGDANVSNISDRRQGDVVRYGEVDYLLVFEGMVIQAAIDAAKTNDTIEVFEGTYNEDVVLDVEGLTLKGPNAGTPGDDSDRGDEAIINSLEIGQKSGSGAPANGAVVKGFEISTNAGLGEGSGTAIGSNSHNIVVEDNVIKNFRTGFTSGLASNNVEDITFTLKNNLFENHVSAISTEGAYEAIIEDNKFYNNRNAIGYNEETNKSNIENNHFLIDDVDEIEEAFDHPAMYITVRGELLGSEQDLIQANDFSPIAGITELDDLNIIAPEGSLLEPRVDFTGPEVSDVELNGNPVENEHIRTENCENIIQTYAVSGEIDFSATIKDELSDVKSAYYRVFALGSNGCSRSSDFKSNRANLQYNDGQWATTEAFDTTLTENDGKYTIVIVSTDSVGNQSTNYVDLLVDNTAPTTPTITSPNARTWHRAAPILNQWEESTDEGSGVAGYQVAYQYDEGYSFSGSTCDGASLSIGDSDMFLGCRDVTSGTSRNHTPAKHEQGGVTIWVRAYDNAGNYSEWSDSVHYYYDHESPTTTIDAPTGVVGGNFTVSGEAQDNLALNRVYVQLVNRDNNNRYGGKTINLIGEGTSANWSRTFDADDLNLPDGDYAAHVSVVDRAGNTGSAGWTEDFTVDNTAPVFLLNPNPGVADIGTTLTVLIQDADAGISGRAGIDFDAPDDVTVDYDKDNPDAFEVSSNVAGTYDITVTMTDNAGNEDFRVAQVTFNEPDELPADRNTDTQQDDDFQGDAVGGGTGAGDVGGGAAPALFAVAGGDQDADEEAGDEGEATEETLGATTDDNGNDNGEGEVAGVTDEADEAGLSWAWWLLIIAAIAALYLLFAKRRAEQE